MTAVDFARWVGVILAVSGAVLAASEAGLHLRDRTAAAVRTGWSWIGGAVGHLQTALRRATTRQLRRLLGLPEPRPATGGGHASGGVRSSGEGGPRPAWSRLSESERVEVLRNKLDALEAARRVDAEAACQLREQIEKLTRDVRDATTAEARGLPLVAAGVVLTGAPLDWLVDLIGGAGLVVLVVLSFLALAAYAGKASR